MARNSLGCAGVLLSSYTTHLYRDGQLPILNCKSHALLNCADAALMPMLLMLLTQVEEETGERNVADVQSAGVSSRSDDVNVKRVNRYHDATSGLLHWLSTSTVCVCAHSKL